MSTTSFVIVPYTSNQEVFDLAARHLLTQKAKARIQRDESSNQRCLYRAPDGCKCAVGALIPDEIYQPEMDQGDTGIDEIISRFPTIATLFSGVDDDLLADLQTVHDDYIVSRWGEHLRALATDYGLSAAVIDELAPEQPITITDADRALLSELAQ